MHKSSETVEYIIIFGFIIIYSVSILGASMNDTFDELFVEKDELNEVDLRKFSAKEFTS